MNLKVAEQYIAQFGNLAQDDNTLILPANVADVAGLIATAMSVVKATQRGSDARAPSTERAPWSCEGSTFIVTGGASGLGAATARMIVDGGGSVVIADLNEDDGTALADALGEAATFVRTDVTDEASGKAAVAAALDALRRPARARQLRRHRARRERSSARKARTRSRASRARSTSTSSARST